MDAASRLSFTRLYNLDVVRKAPSSMDCCLSNDSPMSEGALRVLGVVAMNTLAEALEGLRLASRTLQRLREAVDTGQEVAGYDEIMELCVDTIACADSIHSLARRRSRDLRKEPRTERQMVTVIVKALEEPSVNKKPALKNIEAGGEKAKALRLADGRCELCHAEWHLTHHHILPREEGGLNTAENYMVLCKSCHDEIEDRGYRSRTAIKRHVRSDAVPPAEVANQRDTAEDRKAEKAKAMQAEAEEVSEWAERWGEGFWHHVSYVKLGQLPPPDPVWVTWVYGGSRSKH